jgi:peroxiredoxin (alkyl hydroperoxide reductase subunit C)
MKTVGYKLEEFKVTGVKPGATSPEDAFVTLDEMSFAGKWKVIVFYPKDFTFVCPTEIVAYDKLSKEFADRDAALLIGSTDNEFCKLAWKNAHEDLKKTTCWFFADTQRDMGDSWDNGSRSLVEQLGVFYKPAGAALRATFIVDPENVIQHVTVNNLNVGRNADETLRILDALQTGELCQCNRQVGEKTLAL